MISGGGMAALNLVKTLVQCYRTELAECQCPCVEAHGCSKQA